MSKEEKVLIEGTSKQLKKELLISYVLLPLMFWAGIVISMLHTDFTTLLGSMITLGSVIPLGVVKMKIWWNHA